MKQKTKFLYFKCLFNAAFVLTHNLNQFNIGKLPITISLPSIPLVNFINVKRTNFLYERHVLAAFSSYMYVEK